MIVIGICFFSAGMVPSSSGGGIRVNRNSKNMSLALSLAANPGAVKKSVEFRHDLSATSSTVANFTYSSHTWEVYKLNHIC